MITVLNSIDAHIYVADINSDEILFMNQKMIEDFNADLVGEKCYESFQQEKSPCSICTNFRFLDENKELTGVHTWQSSNPITNQWHLNSGRTINWVDGRTARIQIAMDMTEAKNNEEERKQIEQVFLNIYINAWQAMHRGGELHLETTVVTLDEAFCKPYSINPARYVRISATDTGTGMDKETLKRVFDPFFTTKKRGRGTGLGLSSAYGIVKSHFGTITVYSEIGNFFLFQKFLAQITIIAYLQSRVWIKPYYCPERSANRAKNKKKIL